MTWHPLLIAVLALDGLALLFLVKAAVTHVRVLLGWEPGAADQRQIALEGAADGASLAGRWGLGLFIAASLLLLVGISLVLPVIVSGAMCGTGVLTAMGPTGPQALALRAVALTGLWLYASLDGLNRRCPRPPLVPLAARFALLALPLVALAGLYTLRAVVALDPYEPVDCCQQVYDAFFSKAQATTTLGLGAAVWLQLAGGAGAALLALTGWGLWRLRAAGPGSLGWRGLALLVAASAWLAPAGVALVKVLAAYHYEVLHHHCPWCLLLAEHWGVGYALYGALAAVGLEALALYATHRVAVHHVARGEQAELLGALARRRQRRALWVMLAAQLVFWALTLGPALAWRFEHGVWLHS